jgi:16S rRNA (cytosine967-C5)-methyltransferase
MTGASAAPAAAPALADALRLAAAAWQRFRAGQSLDRALEAALAQAPAVDPAQRGARAGAVRDLAAAAVRRCAQVEHILAALVQRPPEAGLQALLAVALAQLLARSYADFTLVDQAAQAARDASGASAPTGFVNAVLRQFLRRRAELEAAALADPARRANLPDWWWRRLQEDLGAGAAALAAAQLEEPPLVLRVNARRASLAAQRARLEAAGLPARVLGPMALWLERAVPVERIPGFAEGCVSVQDAGAQLAAPWLGVAAGQRVLDACAAPGGKTAHLLELADCRVDALELDAVRARRIEENLRRLGLPLLASAQADAAAGARVIVADALQPRAWWDGRPYDRILLDAPCTASGVVRRHPDVPWLRRPGDVAKLATQQGKMLDALWPLLAPAGRLLYVVCSVFAQEGRRQVAAFVRRQPDARRLPLAPDGPAGDPEGVLLLPGPLADAAAPAARAPLPLLHDGFYYALIEKT